jgi:hypothetical protein
MEETLPAPLRRALTTKTAGATGVVRLTIEGLLEIVEDRSSLVAAADFMSSRLTGYAPLWHIGKAVREDRPADELRRIRTELDESVRRSVRAAIDWARERPGPVVFAPSSSIVSQVLAGLPDRPRQGPATVGLAGADAIGPDQVLNIVGTAELTEKVPVLIVTTSLKLVPKGVFDRLGAPVFERIALAAFAQVVLDGEIVEPHEAGRRAAALE